MYTLFIGITNISINKIIRKVYNKAIKKVVLYTYLPMLFGIICYLGRNSEDILTHLVTTNYRYSIRHLTALLKT